MDIVLVSLFHNEKYIYDKFINGLYGDSGFKLADRGYILNRNNDSEQTKYLKENTTDNISILDRNYDIFRFDVCRNDIYLYADEQEQSLGNKDIIYAMPSIDHFTTSSDWKDHVKKLVVPVSDDEGTFVTTDDISKYQIYNTTCIPDPIKFFKKKDYDYYVNLPVSEDYFSTKTFSVMHESIQYLKPCKYFVHVHYKKDNPNQINNYYRLYLNCLSLYEIENLLKDFDHYEIMFTILVPLSNICRYLWFDIDPVPINLLKRMFLLLLKVKDKTISLKRSIGRHYVYTYKTLTALLYITYLKIMFDESRFDNIDFDFLEKVRDFLNTKFVQDLDALVMHYDNLIKKEDN